MLVTVRQEHAGLQVEDAVAQVDEVSLGIKLRGLCSQRRLDLGQREDRLQPSCRGHTSGEGERLVVVGSLGEHCGPHACNSLLHLTQGSVVVGGEAATVSRIDQPAAPWYAPELTDVLCGEEVG